MNKQLKKMEPPQATQREYFIGWHGKKRNDPYYWLRDKTDPAVMSYLEAENKYADTALEPTAELRETVFSEIKGRIKETDMSAPIQVDEYWYYTRTEAGKDYPIYCRKYASMDAQEEVLFDQNIMAQGYAFYDVDIFVVSPDHRYAAYSVDVTGDESHILYVKDFQTGKLCMEEIECVGTSLEWVADSQSFWYTTRDDIMRPDTVWRHTVGTAAEADVQVWHDPDARYFVSLDKSKDDRYVFISSVSKETAEQWFLETADVTKPPFCVNPRQAKHEYYVEHKDGLLYVLTNHDAPNFRLCVTDISNPTAEHWREIVPTHDTATLEGVEVFASFVCLYVLQEGITTVRIQQDGDTEWVSVSMDEAVYHVQSMHNPNYKNNVLRLYYASLATPPRVIDIDLKTDERTVVKMTELYGYDAAEYVVTRRYAVSHDGVQIPISLVHRRDIDATTPAPCLLEGYGAYGMVEPVTFRHPVVSLLDRGFVFAIAHVRGGGENGQAWYEAGKYLHKQNTFSDYIAVAETLISDGYTKPDRLVATGGSAGGLLMGAVANRRPDLFQTIMADVPFVDVLNTMCDDSLPLTTIEYEEWGDPHDQTYYDYIAAYAPYENVIAQVYPHMMVWAGLHDTRVPYWEAAKWVAKLRSYKTDNNLLVLKTNLTQGHGGSSGRYALWREIAYRYAFILHTLQLAPRSGLAAKTD